MKTALVFGLAILTSAEMATALDCNNAVDQASMNQCAHDDWQAADMALNSAYGDAVDFMQTLDADLPDDQVGAEDALREAQRAWIVFRDKACEAEGYLMQGGSAQPLVVFGCMRVLTEQRTRALSELAGQY